MNTSKIIKGVVSNGRYTVTAPIVKEDYGLYLQIEGVELPSTYEVDFSNSENNGSSVTMIGNSDGVRIPAQFIKSGKDVFAFLYHVGEDFGRTVYKFRIPNKVRPDRTNEEPTPEEQSTIDQTIAALNEAVAQTAQDVESADQSAQSAQEYAEQAETASDTAQEYANLASDHARTASQSVLDSQISASQASAYASASAQSASQSAQIKADVEDLVDDAQGYASASAQSASASAQSASQALSSAQSASSYASSAHSFAISAQTDAQTASAKASEASTSASTASAKATEASQSATNAQGYAQTAEQAKTASQTAQGLAESARDSAISAKEDAEDARDEAQSIVDGINAKAEQIDQNTADIASLEADRYKPYAVDTASGSIASFSDGADNLPLKSLVVDINPIQDLHGQDAPWPAGGGKNKLRFPYAIGSGITVNGVTATVSSDGIVTLNGTATAQAEFPLISTYIDLPAGTYTLSGLPSGGSATTFVYNAYALDENDTILFDYRITSSRTVTVNNPIKRMHIFIRVAKGYTAINLVVKPQFEEGSTATSYAPFENICPISGWTQVQTNVNGINLFDKATTVVGYINDDSGQLKTQGAGQNSKSTDYILVKPNATYYISSEQTKGTWGAWYDKDKNYISGITWYAATSSDAAKFKVAPYNAYYMRLTVEYYTYPDSTINGNVDTFSVNYPSTDNSYHPYTGRSITISLGQTVYGGHLDVLTGILTVYPYYDSYNGETLTGEWISDRDKYVAGTTPTIGAQVVNIGAQGVTVQLEPHEVESLHGVNNIWSDSGDTEVEYRADTKLYIERLTAPDSADMVADANITSGKYFMVGNSLYKATANIANGASIIVGTNCIRKSLSEALNEINA